jgi:hypothetical protein
MGVIDKITNLSANKIFITLFILTAAEVLWGAVLLPVTTFVATSWWGYEHAVAEAQAAARQFAELLRTLPDRLRSVENIDLNIDALHDANVAGHAVSAIDAGTWHVASADASGPD